jgi:hypothetical protein
MSEVIYVIEGTTGEYSDHSEWFVCAYHSRERAEEHARKAMLRAKEIRGPVGSLFHYHVPRGVNEFDPEMQMDYTGTDYNVCEVEVRDEPPARV